MTRIPLRVISAIQLRDLIPTVRLRDLIPTVRLRDFNLDRLISLFTPRRHHVGIHVGLRGPAMCPHRATSPPWVPHD